LSRRQNPRLIRPRRAGWTRRRFPRFLRSESARVDHWWSWCSRRARRPSMRRSGLGTRFRNGGLAAMHLLRHLPGDGYFSFALMAPWAFSYVSAPQCSP
jgi:hypothetical protein